MNSRIRIISLTLAAGAARGATSFSVDNVSDSLVLVDSATGAVTPFAPLGHDVTDVDLACHGGNLYALDSHQGGSGSIRSIHRPVRFSRAWS